MSWAAIGAMLATLACLLLRLLAPTLDRLGERLAEFLLPAHHPVTFRLARGIAHVARRLAAPNSASVRGTDALLGDIEDLKGQHGPPHPLRLSLSLLAPACRSRAGYLADVLRTLPGEILFATVVAIFLVGIWMGGGSVAGQDPSVLRPWKGHVGLALVCGVFCVVCIAIGLPWWLGLGLIAPTWLTAIASTASRGAASQRSAVRQRRAQWGTRR